MGPSFNGRIPGLHPGDEGSIPFGSTNVMRPARVQRSAHNRHAEGSRPSAATSSRGVRPTEGPRSYKPQTRVRLLHSAPVDGGRRQTVRREAVALVLVGSTPIAHPNGT